ncbi:hypothetical protein AB4Z45_11670 [Paenibacillus sp. MCAF9]|uniref:hypothetical protein n=1 Tax=Paenibacillus sp. MCAF9 TaxID=3233046 RepID=UPI003F94400B
MPACLSAKQGADSKVILRFFEHYLELIFIEKKDLKLHYTAEFEVLSFENGDVSLMQRLLRQRLQHLHLSAEMHLFNQIFFKSAQLEVLVHLFATFQSCLLKTGALLHLFTLHYRFVHITIIRRASLMLDMVSLSYYALQAATKGKTELRGRIFAVGKTND